MFIGSFFSEVAIWIFGKLLRLKTSGAVDDELGGLIQDQLLPIAAALPNESRVSLVTSVIDALHGPFRSDL